MGHGLPRRFAPRNDGIKMKRLFDLTLAVFAGCILLAPVLVVAALVRLTSKGPALYWSDRVGRR